MGGGAASDLCCNRGLIPSARECAAPVALFRQRFPESLVAGFSHPCRSGQNTGRTTGRRRPDRLISGVPWCRSNAANGKRWIVRVQNPPIFLPRSGRAAFGLRSDEIRPSKPCILHIFEHRRIWSTGTGLRSRPGLSAGRRSVPRTFPIQHGLTGWPNGAAIRGCNPATPPVHARSKTTDAERCRSGRTGRSRKPLTLCGVPGFESLSLRQ